MERLRGRAARVRRWTAAVAAATTVATVCSAPAHAQRQSGFTIAGPGVAGSFVLTYGPATDARYPGAYEVTGITGTFTDTNHGLGIVNASVTGLVPITHATPDTSNHLAPADFSRFAVAAGTREGSLAYTNLYWPGGSPQTATDYPPQGGFLDIYGLLFSIGGGRVVNIWSDGDMGDGVTYGAAVATADAALDYTFAGVTATTTPEPGPAWLVGIGGAVAAGVAARRRRRPA